ncbi:sushi, von Willebrand factor type A, EGF and pentraxin domain-containing protein 1 [Strongylocentrotus purpuratus]|uniref:Uncharacterized protein n=1 Tax=Strongylocentrotus purpuratus TaxID=7668 RepID=A0A7M7T4K1_STRPU|nr:sushi, von Willebrand factor type A, EGF and pentraxin domain-containing protein 1 [Strongylocentrotus purpuratus]
MEEKSFHYLVLFTGLFLCLLHSDGVSSSCDNINQIDFAEITYEPEGLAPHPDGTVASIECGVSYQILPTAFERTTCTDGSWTGPLPQCRHVRSCIVPPYPRDGWWQNANEYPQGTSVPHNTRLQLGCNWRFDERRSSVKCNDGVWSDSDEVHRLCRGTPCEVRWSSDVALNITYDPPVSNEDRLNHLIQHDTRVHYDCAWGYRLRGVTERRCEEGSYNHNIPRCELVPCPAEDVSHGRLTYTTPDGVHHENPLHGDTRLLRCGSGYRSRSFSMSRCDNGVWVEGSHDIRCDPKPCDPIPDTMGRVDYTGTAQANGKYSYGTEVTVNCDSGYLPAYGNGTAVCNASQWLTVIPTCTQSRNIILDSHTYVSQTPPKRMIANAWLARDGNTNSAPQYCSRTQVTNNPWWKAVMKDIYNFTGVKIYNRLDREEHRYDLVGAEIRVGLNDYYTTNMLCGEPVTRRQIESSTEASHGIPIRCVGEGVTGVIGNVISVHIPTINNQKRELSLCEVEAYQQGLSISVNGAENGMRVGCVVPRVENAVVLSTNVATQQVLLEGEEVRISCHARHVLRGSDTRHVDLTCLGDSSWDQDKPVCEPETCTVDRLFNGGFLNGKILYNHGENITFTCNPGYEKEHDRYWCDRRITVPGNPRCIQASCHAPDLPDHMVSSQSQPHFPHGTLLDVSCEYGFQLSRNQEQLRCYRGGWSTPLTATCQRVSCGHPVRASYSIIEILPGVQGYVQGTRVRYSCSEGWEIEGITERECVNGQWTGSTPTCRVAAPPRCMLPDRSSGQRYSIRGFIGNIFDEGLPIGERVSISVSCNQGYTAQPSVQTACLEGGVWSVAVPICVRIERLCPSPGYISHVVQYVNGLETNRLDTYPNDELPEGTFLVSRCSLPGQYVLRGSANRTCSDSSWTGEEPRCDDADTTISFQNDQPLDVRSNGTIVIHPRSRLYISCRVPSHNVARFESENGPFAVYRGQGLSTMVMSLNPPRTSQSGRFTCRSNDYTPPHTVYVQFAEIYCDRPTAPTNGEFQDYDYGWEYGRFYMGKEISFACNDGYILDGERTMTCVLGEWSHPTPRCQRHRATCEELHPPTHGTKVGGNRIGDSVLIGCNQGYQLQGEPFLDCQESGNWSHPLPSCVEIVESEGPCDSVSCKVWQKCETDSSGVGVCRCISHHSCPVTDEPVVCGTDGRNYTNLCRLMALACIRNTGVEVASSNWFCINGVPERALLTPTPFIEIEEPSQLSSFESTYEESPPSIPEPAVREPITLPPNEGPVLEPDTPSFCHAGVCPSSSAAELSQGATAIVIAYADNWDADLGILRIQIYEVMAGGLPSWTEDSYQDVLIDVGAASERGCLCPSFQAVDPVIIRFSQNLRQDGKGQLLHTDIVLPYSRDLYHEIRLLLEDYKPCGEAGNVLVAGDNHQANEKAWPWLSVIHRNSSTGWKMACSGTLLCQQWVLTTSSCFANIDDAEVIGEMLVTIDLEDSQFIPEEIKVTVTMGEYNRSLGEGCEQTIQVDRIVLHDQFDYENIHDYDIALLHLSEPVELNSCARTICLPSETDSPHEPKVVGWGTASGLPQNAHDVPLQFPMPLADQAECRVDHARDGFDVTDRMLCAGEGLGTDIRCHGDSGSPLMYQRSGDDKWALLGISTKGELCSRRSRHGIFTRIEPGFKGWINGVTDDCFNNHIPTATILNA